MKQITINNNTYNSIAEAWRALSPDGLSQITVRQRLLLGWTPEQAFLTPVVPPQERRGWKQQRLY